MTEPPDPPRTPDPPDPWNQPPPPPGGPQPAAAPPWGTQLPYGDLGGLGGQGGQAPPYGYGAAPGWGHGGPGQPAGYAPPQQSGRATAVLVLGIVSLVLLLSCIGFIPGIVALALAPGARREIAASGGRLTGEGQVRAGVIMAWVTLGLTIVVVLGLAAVIMVSAASSS